MLTAAGGRGGTSEGRVYPSLPACLGRGISESCCAANGRAHPPTSKATLSFARRPGRRLPAGRDRLAAHPAGPKPGQT